MDLTGRHLITFDNWTKEEIEVVLERAVELKRKYKNHELTNLLINQTLFMIFFEQSTRTRNSMEAAMTQLGGHAHDLNADKMQISHGETPRDTAQVLSRMGEAIAIRNCFHGIGNDYLNKIADHSNCPLISMQDDIYHPLQVIADFMTMREHFGKNLKGLKVAVSWAYATSHAKPLSVPQSQILFLPRFGVDVVVGNPKEFPLDPKIIEKAKKNAEAGGGSLTFADTMEDCVKDADIVFPKNWGGFAFFDEFVHDDEHFGIMKENLGKYKSWRYDKNTHKLTKNAKIMHALPADRNNEITDEMIDGPNSIVIDEAENRLHTAKSILSLVLRNTKL